MNDRKDDIIIGLLVIIIILQVYGLFFGEPAATTLPSAPTTIQAPAHGDGGAQGHSEQTRTEPTPSTP